MVLLVKQVHLQKEAGAKRRRVSGRTGMQERRRAAYWLQERWRAGRGRRAESGGHVFVPTWCRRREVVDRRPEDRKRPRWR